MNVNGYETKTTFYLDFSIADRFGIAAVKDTYNRAFKEWKDNHEYLTELVMVLNWKVWEHYGNNDDLATTYNDLWMAADSYACNNLVGEELNYFLRVTD